MSAISQAKVGDRLRWKSNDRIEGVVLEVGFDETLQRSQDAWAILDFSGSALRPYDMPRLKVTDYDDGTGWELVEP